MLDWWGGGDGDGDLVAATRLAATTLSRALDEVAAAPDAGGTTPPPLRVIALEALAASGVGHDVCITNVHVSDGTLSALGALVLPARGLPLAGGAALAAAITLLVAPATFAAASRADGDASLAYLLTRAAPLGILRLLDVDIDVDALETARRLAALSAAAPNSSPPPLPHKGQGGDTGPLSVSAYAVAVAIIAEALWGVNAGFHASQDLLVQLTRKAHPVVLGHILALVLC